MAGGYYIALSGMQSRMNRLDHLASDIANVSTAGYKTERTGTVESDRPSFGAALQSAVDVTDGPTKLDLRPGPRASTGRPLDLAIEGPGFFVVETPAGPRYTRNGHLTRRADGVLTTDEGDVIQGTGGGSIKVESEDVLVEPDGTIRSGGTAAGKLKVVEFDADAQLVKEGSHFRTDSQPHDADHPSIASGALEQSNVSMADRMAELTDISRSYQMLLRAMSVLMNDVDQRAVSELGRR